MGVMGANYGRNRGVPAVWPRHHVFSPCFTPHFYYYYYYFPARASPPQSVKEAKAKELEKLKRGSKGLGRHLPTLQRATSTLNRATSTLQRATSGHRTTGSIGTNSSFAKKSGSPPYPLPPPPP